VYDDWLYPVFESAGLAERRSAWLGRALAPGPGSVRFVVTTGDSPALDGPGLNLLRLGFRASNRFGDLYVWARVGAGPPPR
jgi:hypothetical protein